MVVITIGRSIDNNVVIQNPTVSRHHVQIIRHNNGSFGLLDLNSTNGTFVNGRRVVGEVRLQAGDVVRIGNTRLPWERYFRSERIPNKQSVKTDALLWVSGIAGGLLMLVINILFLNFLADSFVKSKKDNVNTRVLVFFDEDTSSRDVVAWLKKRKAIVVDSDLSYGYFLAGTRSEKDAVGLVKELKKRSDVDFVIRDEEVKPCGISMTVVDDFTNPMKGETISHGEMVVEAMSMGENAGQHPYDVTKFTGKGKPVTRSVLASGIMNACDMMSDDDLNIVNLSWGVSESIYDKKLKKKVRKDEEQLIRDYADEVVEYATIASRCGKRNFIITKAMGNNSIHHIDDAYKLALSHRDMDSVKLKALKEHIVIVAAKDTRKEYPKEYSNRMRDGVKVDGVNTIMVDLSKLPTVQAGTSAAAPLVAGWIAKNNFRNAQDAIKAINTATQTGELVSERTFKETANKIVGRNTSYSEEVAEVGDEGSLTVEGVLKMYVLNSDGLVKVKTTTNDLDYTDDYVAFVIDTDQPVDVTSYLDESERNWLDSNVKSSFMIVSSQGSLKRKFANAYAYKRVRITGHPYVPMAGWRNATEVVIDMNGIQLVDKEKPKPVAKPQSERTTPASVSSSGHRGVSSSLVGTKWSFENGYRAERRTIEFTSTNTVRYTIEDINIWTDRAAPIISTHDCYFDSSMNRIIIDRKSNMVLLYSLMQMRLDGNTLIEDTNQNVEVEYERVR